MVLLAAAALAVFGCDSKPPLGPTAGALAPAHHDAGATIPLTDLGSGYYLGEFQGGLYEDGSNEPPADFALAGEAVAGTITPLDTLGLPDPAGKVLFLSVGMSTTAMIWSTFINKAGHDAAVDRTSLVVFQGARAGQTSGFWYGRYADKQYRRVNTKLAERGFSPAQVQAVCMCPIVRHPAKPLPAASATLPDPEANAHVFARDLGEIARELRRRYPNLKVAFVTSYIYGGYAEEGNQAVVEPLAYEGAWGARRAILAQIRQLRTGEVDPLVGDMSLAVAPLLAWGPYWWADGLIPRSDGLTWAREEYTLDGTHPNKIGRPKAAMMLLEHFKASPFSRCWFLAAGSC